MSEAVRKFLRGEELSEADLNDPELAAMVQAHISTLPGAADEGRAPAYPGQGRRLGPDRYVPSGESRGPSAAERAATLKGMLPGGAALWELLMALAARAPANVMNQGVAQEFEDYARRFGTERGKRFEEVDRLYGRKRPSAGMLPLPGGARG